MVDKIDSKNGENPEKKNSDNSKNSANTAKVEIKEPVLKKSVSLYVEKKLHKLNKKGETGKIREFMKNVQGDRLSDEVKDFVKWYKKRNGDEAYPTTAQEIEAVRKIIAAELGKNVKKEERLMRQREDAALKRFTETYDLSADERLKLKASIANASTSNIESILKTKENLLVTGISAGFLPEWTDLIPKKELAILRLKFPKEMIRTFSESERHGLINLLNGHAEMDEEIWNTMKRILNPADQRMLLKEFLGTVSLAELSDKDLVTDDWIRSQITSYIKREGLDSGDAPLTVDDFSGRDLRSIFVPADEVFAAVTANGKNIDLIVKDSALQERITSTVRSIEKSEGLENEIKKTIGRLESFYPDVRVSGERLFLDEAFLKNGKTVYVTIESETGEGESARPFAEQVAITNHNGNITVETLDRGKKVDSWNFFDMYLALRLVKGKKWKLDASMEKPEKILETKEDPVIQKNLEDTFKKAIDQYEKEEAENQKKKDEYVKANFAKNVDDKLEGQKKDDEGASSGAEKKKDGTAHLPENMREPYARLMDATTDDDAIRALNDLLGLEEFIGMPTELKPNETTIELGSADRVSSFYNIFTFAGVDLVGKKVILNAGNPNLEPEKIPFNQFLSAFMSEKTEKGKTEAKAKIIDPITSAESFLSHLQKIEKGSEIYGNLRVKGGKFVDEYREHEEGYTATDHFLSSDGHLLKIISLENGKAVIDFHEGFKEEEKEGKFEVEKTRYDNQEVSYAHLAYLFKKYDLQNKGDNKALKRLDGNKEAAVAEKDTHNIHTEHGGLKHLFANASIHDLLHGMKGFADFIKHKLEHGNHLQEARIMLALADKFGMKKLNHDWYLDLKSKVENDEIKLVDDRVKELSDMSSPARQESIRESLLNDGTHDYEHWANAITMLEKHGTLYVGKLKDLEGTFIYLKRIAAVPLGTKIESIYWYTDPVKGPRNIGHLIQELKDNKEPVTEEAILREYLKKTEGMNAQMWRRIKTRWEKGFPEERDNGKKEADAFMTTDRRNSYSLEKMRDGEYYHAIGAALSLGGKESLKGSAADKHTPWFIMAVSNIPGKLHQNVKKDFAKYYKEWRAHSPALLFMETSEDQEKFRQTVLSLARFADRRISGEDKDGKITSEFQAVLNLVRKEAQGGEKFDKDGNNLIHQAILKFWKNHSATLQPLLTGSANDPVLIYQMNKDPAIKNYVEQVKSGIGDMNLEGTELDNGTYLDHGKLGASFSDIHPKKILGNIRVNANAESITQGETVPTLYWNHFIDSVKAVHNIKPTSAELEKSNTKEKRDVLIWLYRERQKIVYERLHKDFFEWATRAFGWWKYDLIMRGGEMRALRDLGYYSPDETGKPVFSPVQLGNEAAYQKQLTLDFDKFYAASNVEASIPSMGTTNVQDTTAKQTNSILQMESTASTN